MVENHETLTSDDPPHCDTCGSTMQPHYENNGFEPPEGPPHYEIAFFYCPICVDKKLEVDYGEN